MAYSVEVAAVKKGFFSATTTSGENHPVELFQVFRSFIHASPKEQDADHSANNGEEFVQHLANYVTLIHSGSVSTKLWLIQIPWM